MSEGLVLIDGSGFIYRAFYSMPPMQRRDGVEVNAVYGFCAMLSRLLERIETQRIAVIFDHGGGNFRHNIYPKYKANRPKKPEALQLQLQMMHEAALAYGLPAITAPNYEADDLIASYAKRGSEAGMKIVIVSSDKDLMQLVRNNPPVKMFDPIKNQSLGTADVVKKFGVSPDKVVEVQALAGDAVDNVPGIAGIGVKTAAKLINQFGSLEEVLKNPDLMPSVRLRQAIREHSEEAVLSKKLVQLYQDVPLPVFLSEIKRRDDYHAGLSRFLKKNEFYSIGGNGNLTSLET